jgi:phage-related protein
MGGSDDTARYYSADMYELISMFINKLIKGESLYMSEITKILIKIYTNYGFAKMITMLERAEIPIISSIVGIIRTATNVCHSIEEFNNILKELNNNQSNTPGIPMIGCSTLNLVTSYGSNITNKVSSTAAGIYTNVSNFITQEPTTPNDNKESIQKLNTTDSGSVVGGGGGRRRPRIWTTYLKKYKKKQRHIKKTKKYNKKRNKY